MGNDKNKKAKATEVSKVVEDPTPQELEQDYSYLYRKNKNGQTPADIAYQAYLNKEPIKFHTNKPYSDINASKGGEAKEFETGEFSEKYEGGYDIEIPYEEWGRIYDRANRYFGSDVSPKSNALYDEYKAAWDMPNETEAERDARKEAVFKAAYNAMASNENLLGYLPHNADGSRPFTVKRTEGYKAEIKPSERGEQAGKAPLPERRGIYGYVWDNNRPGDKSESWEKNGKWIHIDHGELGGEHLREEKRRIIQGEKPSWHEKGKAEGARKDVDETSDEQVTPVTPAIIKEQATDANDIANSNIATNDARLNHIINRNIAAIDNDTSNDIDEQTKRDEEDLDKILDNPAPASTPAPAPAPTTEQTPAQETIESTRTIAPAPAPQKLVSDEDLNKIKTSIVDPKTGEDIKWWEESVEGEDDEIMAKIKQEEKQLDTEIANAKTLVNDAVQRSNISSVYNPAIYELGNTITNLEERKKNAEKEDEVMQRKARNMQMIAGISDSLTALANLIGTSKGGNNINLGTGALTPLQQRAEAARLERKADIKSISDRLDQYKAQQQQMKLNKGVALANYEQNKENARIAAEKEAAKQAYKSYEDALRRATQIEMNNARIASNENIAAAKIQADLAKEAAKAEEDKKKAEKKAAEEAAKNTSTYIFTDKDASGKTIQTKYSISKKDEEAILRRFNEFIEKDKKENPLNQAFVKALSDWEKLSRANLSGLGSMTQEEKNAFYALVQASPSIRAEIERNGIKENVVSKSQQGQSNAGGNAGDNQDATDKLLDANQVGE